VKLLNIEQNRVVVEDIDVVDNTPLLDIKPYIKEFDTVADSLSGWLKADRQDIVHKRSDGRFG
jgi:tRNA (Thr-GGU) A37 N-methylase